MDGRTDGRMEFLPIIQDFVPCWGHCPATLWDFTTSKKQGKGTAEKNRLLLFLSLITLISCIIKKFIMLFCFGSAELCYYGGWDGIITFWGKKICSTAPSEPLAPASQWLVVTLSLHPQQQHMTLRACSWVRSLPEYSFRVQFKKSIASKRWKPRRDESYLGITRTSFSVCPPNRTISLVY